jgi:hypothetical protein
MSFAKKLIAAGSIFAMAAALAPTASAVTVNPTNSNSGNFIYCSNVAPFIATSDVNAILVTTGSITQFNYTQNIVANVENGVCKPTAVITGTVPFVTDHATSFDLDSAGKITNIKVSNTNPSEYTVACSGADTVLTVTDKEKDALALTGNISGAADFNVTNTTETGKIKITFKKKDNTFTGSNAVNLYVTETPTSLVTANYGNSAPATSLTAFEAATVVPTGSAYDVIPGFVNFKLDVNGNCTTASSSSSMSSKSSVSSVSSTSMSSEAMSSKSSMTSKAGTAGNDNDPKGNTPRTGGF